MGRTLMPVALRADLPAQEDLAGATGTVDGHLSLDLDTYPLDQ